MHRHWLLLLCAALASAQPPPFALSDDVVPVRYFLDLTIDPSREVFDGRARIEVDVRVPASTIWLNATGLTVEEATADGRAARAVPAGGELLGLELDTPAKRGRALLSIRYQGRLAGKAAIGAFRMQFEGNWYVLTTFTPIGARSVFPCFDQPRFKTPWEVTLHVKRELRAFANASQIEEREEPDGMKAVRFAPTAPIPSDLVAFAVGPLDTLDAGRTGLRHVPVRVITPRGHAAEGQEAARATGEVLSALESYTGIPYPYDKLDHVALPEGTFGATENPGLITYRMRALLRAQPRQVRGLLAHELAHQWFGNLVTPAAWEDVWLSEGFATWLSQRVVEPRYLGLITSRARIMLEDAGPKTRPVRLPMHDREGLKGVYNPLVYQKGAAILLMLEGWLGEDRLRAGLRAYLEQHRFGAATTADLEADLPGAAPVLHDFLDQTGIPTVRAELRCDPGKPRLILEQVNAAAKWNVPVCWRADGVAPSCALVDSRREVDLAACPAWIYPNAGATGYYRTAWSPAQLAAIEHHGLSHLTAAERLALVFDLRALPLDRAVIHPLLAKLAADPEPAVAQAARAPERREP